MNSVEIKPLDVRSASIAQLKRAIADRTPLIGITCFGTHDWPDIDELSAITVIQKLGGKIFPNLAGKKHLRLQVITENEVGALGEDAWYKLLQEGCLAVGTAGGPTDDHGQGEKTSATQKVAEFLGVENLKWLKQLLGYVNHEDNSGIKSIPDGFSGVTGPMVKTAWRLLREDGRGDEMIEEAEYFIKLIKHYLVDQRRFQEAVKELKGEIRLVPLPNVDERTPGRTPKIAVVESGNERATGVVRYIHNRHQDLLVIVRIEPSGNFQIHHAKEDSVSTEQMDEVVAALRGELICWMNKGLPPKKRIGVTWEDLTKDRRLKGTEAIYYYRDGQMIYNGTLTQPGTMGLVGNDIHRRPFNANSLIKAVVSALNKETSQDESLEERSPAQNVQTKGLSPVIECTIEGTNITVTLTRG